MPEIESVGTLASSLQNVNSTDYSRRPVHMSAKKSALNNHTDAICFIIMHHHISNLFLLK